MTEMPPWTRNSEVNLAYQKVLTWKEPEHYEEIFDMVQLEYPEFPWGLLRGRSDGSVKWTDLKEGKI